MSVMNPWVFREYDIRGLVGEDLTEKTVRLLGRAYGTFLKDHGVDSAVVGRDNRLSSFAYSKIVSEGLQGSGVDVISIGMVTTPVLYFARVRYGAEGGVMVTGSHNPPEFNGFKLAYGPDTLYGEGIQEIRRIAEGGRFTAGSGMAMEKDPVLDYVEDIAQRIQLGKHRVVAVVDAGNGSSGPIARKVLNRIGASYEEMFFEPDGTFPNHHPDPTRTKNLRHLAQRVTETQADLGIAFDGDADRIGVVDRTGAPVWGDELQTLFWREILARNPGALALVEVKCSQSLVDCIKEWGGVPEFTRTGHSLIKARMREADALFTGEMSGHMFFRDEYYGFDDAVYAACRLLRLLSETGEKLDEILKSLPKYCSTPEVRVDCPDERKFDVVSEITRMFSQDFEVITVDGARVLFPDGWGLVRASNTQPALVIRAEAKTEQGLESIKSAIEDRLGGFPVVGAIEWE